MRNARRILPLVLAPLVACGGGGGTTGGEPTAAVPGVREVAGRGDPEVDRALLERLASLDRLGAIETPPRDDAERRAAQIVARASEAARRGDYPRALALLEQAEQAAPDYLPIYPVRANVAYLTGAVDVAIDALERGLETDPANPLLRENLERLEAEPLRIGRRP